MTVLVGTHTYAASGDAERRQAAAMEALRRLRGVSTVNVQFAEEAHVYAGIDTLAVLTRDSRVVTGRAGPRKPIVSDILDALWSRASAKGCSSFVFMNADIHLSQEAIDWIAGGAHDAVLLSREDVDPASGKPIGMSTAGTDVLALSTAWWGENRARFRPYIAGEAVWDNVYTAIIMCHANAALENRTPLAHHEAHPAAWAPGGGPYADYTRYLAALDAGYFSLWCRYWAGLQELRRARAGVDAERALAREVFVWSPSLPERVVQRLRDVKARFRFFLRRNLIRR